jgi:hypothetical protein
MTEDQIERRVERAMDRLDARLMDGRLSQAEYDREVIILDKWASQQAVHRLADIRRGRR